MPSTLTHTLRSSQANTTTEVVPSPTSSSCTLEMSAMQFKIQLDEFTTKCLVDYSRSNEFHLVSYFLLDKLKIINNKKIDDINFFKISRLQYGSLTN